MQLESTYLFVDSDDYITENLYPNLLPYMEQKYDMIKFKIAKVDEQGNVLEKNYTPLFEEKSGEGGIRLYIKQMYWKLHGVICIKEISLEEINLSLLKENIMKILD